MNGRDTYGGATAGRFRPQPARVTLWAEASQRPSLEAAGGADLPERGGRSRVILNKPGSGSRSRAVVAMRTCFSLLDIVRIRGETLPSFPELGAGQDLWLSANNASLKGRSDNLMVVSIRVIETVKKYGPLKRTTQIHGTLGVAVRARSQVFGLGALATRELE